MKASNVVVFILLSFVIVGQTFAGRIYYEKCEYKGFSCVKSPKIPGKYDITFVCNTVSTWDIELYLWQFRAPTTITSLRVANCTSVKLNLICTSEGRPIQQLRLSNITHLSIVPLQHGLSHTPPEVVLEDIRNMDGVPSRSFLQIKRFPFIKYGCANPLKDLDTVVFKNVRLGTIEREAFHNLIDMKNFTFENVTIDRIHAAGIQIFQTKDTALTVSYSNIGVMEYLSFFVRGSKMRLFSTSVKEMHSSAINATVYEFEFYNNSIGWLHCAAMSILAQNVRIMDSTFDYIASGAFQAIGPGLPENSLRGFGQLKFMYEFRNNLIESLEVGSLHSDWRAYKNVGSVINFSYNAIKCTCAELAWLGSREGFGKEFSSLDDFHEIVLKKENNNICADAPCILPVEAVQLMKIKDGRCLHNITQEYLCDIYYPTSTSTVKTTTVKAKVSTNKLFNNALLYQKRLPSRSAADKKTVIIFLFIFILFVFLL